LRAVEFLIPLAVLVCELNHEFEVRAMKTCVSLDLPVAERKDPLHVRFVVRPEINISTRRGFRQRAFNYRRGPASYTFNGRHHMF